MFRTHHSFDQPPPIKAWHVTAARMLYTIHGGRTVRGLERALAACNRRNAPRAVARVLEQLLEIERKRDRKRMGW